jgi:hypothetical protein
MAENKIVFDGRHSDEEDGPIEPTLSHVHGNLNITKMGISDSF